MLVKNEMGLWTLKKETLEEYLQRVWGRIGGGEPDSFQKDVLKISFNDSRLEPDDGSDEGYMHIAGIDQLDEDGHYHKKMLNLAKVILCSYALVCYNRSTRLPFDPKLDLSIDFGRLAFRLDVLMKKIEEQNEGYF